MHGIVWWRSSSVYAQIQQLFAMDAEQDTFESQPAWSKLVTWQDQRCSPKFLQQCDKEILQHASDADASSSSPLATGYGLATYAHILATESESLEQYDACGTIQDFLAFVLCGHRSPVDASIDTTNAFSWGGFDIKNADWNRQT